MSNTLSECEAYIFDSRYMPLDILDKAGGRMPYVDVMNQLLSSTDLTSLQIPQLLRTMKEEGLVSGSLTSGSRLQIEQPGRVLLLSLRKGFMEQSQLAQEKFDENAKQEKQQRFENKISVAQLFVSAVSFVLGLLAEHWLGITEFILSILH